VSDALVADSLTKRYRRRVALDHCSFAISEGAIVALVGPNGAGKSTLLHCATWHATTKDRAAGTRHREAQACAAHDSGAPTKREAGGDLTTEAQCAVAPGRSALRDSGMMADTTRLASSRE
jgi:ATPase subunit of ABC transporter with duplicated ATPase domains